MARSQPDFRPKRDVSAAVAGGRDESVAGRPKRDVEDAPTSPRDVRVTDVVARLATRQQGMVTRSQLLATGLSPERIQRWVKRGSLHRVHRGVYAVGHMALAPWAHEAAAILACGSGAIISHRSATYVWGLIEPRPDEVDITVIGRRRRRKEGLRLHLASKFDKRDLRRRHGLPVTSPARTLIDLAAEASPVELERLVAEARVKRLLKPGELERAGERAGTRPGTRRIRALLQAEGTPGITRSAAERILRRLLREARLPQPQTNVRVRMAGASYEVDFLWPEQKVVIEVDSWQFHGHRRAFETDRRKTMALDAAGYHVIRITATQLELEPFVVIAQVARALDRAARMRG